MKNITRLIWLIALTVVIGLSMAACGDKEDDEGEYTYTFINNSTYAITMSFPESYSFTPSKFDISPGGTKTAISTR